MKKILLFLLLSINAFALDVPILTRPVMDLTNSISEDKKIEVENLVRDLYEKGYAQVSYLIIPTLNGESLEGYSMKVAENWKLGEKQKDNGLLVLISMKEKKIRVEVGYGLEGAITDIDSNRIIDSMKPFMRNNNLIGALKIVLERVTHLLEYDKQKERQKKGTSSNLQESVSLSETKTSADSETEKESTTILITFLFFLGGVLILFFGRQDIKTKEEYLKECNDLDLEIKLSEEKLSKLCKELEKIPQIDHNKLTLMNLSNELSSTMLKYDNLVKQVDKAKKYFGV